MSCGGRIYKGDTVYVSVPFDVEGYSALTISFFTNGEYKITRTEEEVTIEDGFITAVFEGHDLDVLPDGVLRYTIECEVEGEEYVDSSNTMLYLKTPKDYDAADVQDFYNSGWTEGFSSGLTQGFPIGYESGHTDGQAEGYASGYTEGYDSGYTTGRSKGWQDGIDYEYNRVSQSAITLSFSGNGEWHKDFFSEVFCNGVNVNIDFGLVRNIAIYIDGNNIVISEPIGELGIQSQGNYYLTTANHDYGVGTWKHYAILREGFQTSNLQVSNVNFKVKTSDFENWVNPSYVLLFNGHWNEWTQHMDGGFKINIDRVSTSTDGDYTWIYLVIL